MIKWPYSIREIHIEPTDVCNAACPQCLRETDPFFDKSMRHELTVDFFAKSFSEDTVKHLDKVFACGNYGDPVSSSHLVDIFRWFRSINPDITLGINTNGSIRNPSWWRELAELFTNPNDYVVFSIDGLEDTNHIYRVNCQWKKIMENSRAFIENGGIAHWDMLVFKHNEHQVNACMELAKSMGFSWFRSKASKRRMINGLELSTGTEIPEIGTGDISCIATNTDSIYVDSRGKIYPCCWLGSEGLWTLNKWDTIKSSWKDGSISWCSRNCRTNSKSTTVFHDQWKQEIQLK